MIKIFCVYKITNLINSKSYIGIRNPKCKKYILMINKDTNEILNKFGSTREAARFLGNENKYRSIAYCLSGKIKTSQGYFWKYEE